MLNKVDIKPFDQLSEENQQLLTEFLNTEGVKFYKTSNVSKEGIMDMRNEACDQLLTQVSWTQELPSCSFSPPPN